MKNIKLLLTGILATVLTVGCAPSTSEQVPTEPSSEDIPTTSNPITSEESVEPSVPSTSTEEEGNRDPVTGELIDSKYIKIHDYLYVTYLPGQYDESILLDFYVPSGYKLLYSLDCEDPDTEYKGDALSLKQLKTTKKSQIPLTTSVDGILSWAGSDKCYSGIYVDNIQKPGNYQYFDRINVVTVKVVSVNDPSDVKIERALSYMISDVEHTIPVVSLSMPYDKWFGEEEGFYNQIRDEIEQRCNLEYWDSTYDEYFFRNTQIKLGGNWTLGYPMRTLNLNFNKDQYGEKNDKVKEHIWKERQKRDGSGDLTKINRFRLWSGGNSFESGTGFNDAIIQQLMEKDTYTATAGWRPCITYCNGEYWGMYYIREHYKDVYFETNYGVDKDDVIFAELKGDLILDDGDEELGNKFIQELKDFYTSFDFASDVNYNTAISKYIDIDSFIDLFIAETYASNWDFVGNFNNLKMWRTSYVDEDKPYYDGKWRFVIHDVDFAFTEDTDFIGKDHPNYYRRWPLFNNLMKNAKFRTAFYERAEELMETNFKYEVAEEIVKGMMNEVKAYKRDAMRRWGKLDADYEYGQWLNNIQNVLNYIKSKETTFLPMLEKYMK